jgi:hypothetical protein
MGSNTRGGDNMTIIRTEKDPLERCGQGIGCGAYIFEKGFCDACTKRLIDAIDKYLKERHGVGFYELVRQLFEDNQLTKGKK